GEQDVGGELGAQRAQRPRARRARRGEIAGVGLVAPEPEESHRRQLTAFRLVYAGGMPTAEPRALDAARLPPHEPIRRILSLDGGPEQLVNVRVLRSIAEEVPHLLDSVDLFAGTSFGSYAVLYLALATSRGVPAVKALDDCALFLDE